MIISFSLCRYLSPAEMANLRRLHPGQAKLMLPTGGKAAMLQTIEKNRGTAQG